MEPCLGYAEMYIKHLTGSSMTPVTWQIFGDRKEFNVIPRVINGSLEDKHRELIRLNKQGAGVFVTVNETDLKGRKAHNVVGLRALFIDKDDGETPQDINPKPSFIVQSGRGPHVYWRLTPGQAIDEFVGAQQSLVKKYDADAKCCDVGRVMRCPGFVHQKGDPYLVTMETVSQATYEIKQVAPLVPRETLPLAPPPPVKIHTSKIILRAQRYLAKVPAAVEGAGGDAATLKAAYVGGDFNLSESEFWPLLREWNQGCSPPWDEKDLRKKLESATKYRKKPLGTALEGRPQAEKADDPQSTAIQELSENDKLKPNDIGKLIALQEKLMRDGSGNTYQYTGTHWASVSADELKALAKKYDSSHYTSIRRRNESIEYALTEPDAQRGQIEWGQINPTEVPLSDGVLDFISGTVRPHRPGDLLNTTLPYGWVPEAQAPTLRRALDDWFDGDDDSTDKITGLQQFFGYLLMSHARYKKALVLYGESNTGKSVIINLIRSMVGQKNTCQIGIERMGDPRALAPIKGKMVNLVSELEDSAMVADGGFKQLVSSDEAVLIDPKFKTPEMYLPHCKHVFATNNLPNISDRTSATYNRLLIIRFKREIDEAQQDRDLLTKLVAEMPGIVRWAVDGARMLFQEGGEFCVSDDSKEIVREYRQEQNPVAAFVAECCEEKHGLRIELGRFRERFREWHGRNVSTQFIGRALSSIGHKPKATHGARYIDGLDWIS